MAIGLKKSDPTPYSFKACAAYKKDSVLVLADNDLVSEQGGTLTKVMRIDRTGSAGAGPVQWVATRVCVREVAKLREIFVTGPDGSGYENIGGTLSEAPIDAGKTGPRVHGAIRDLRVVGSHVYATGMRRQVYRREAPGQWVHLDKGALQEPLLTTIAGFNSIDGISESELYAAGFGGEIWLRKSDEWTQLSSPTNVILNKVLVVGKQVFICGQRGTLLRGRGERWEVLEGPDEDLWDMAWFQDQLWVAGDEHLFTLSGNVLDQAEVSFLPKGKKKASTEPTVGSLCSAEGVLWSVGRKHVLWTNDGTKWTDVTP